MPGVFQGVQELHQASGGENMSEDLYDLYQRDEDFKKYVDKWAKNHDLSIYEVFRFNILQEYAKWLKEVKK